MAAEKAQVGVHGLVGSVDGSPGAEANVANAYWGGWPVYNRPQLRLVKYREDFGVFAVPPCLECRQPVAEEPTDCLVCGVGRAPTDGRLTVLPLLVDPFNPVFMVKVSTIPWTRDEDSTRHQRRRPPHPCRPPHAARRRHSPAGGTGIVAGLYPSG